MPVGRGGAGRLRGAYWLRSVSALALLVGALAGCRGGDDGGAAGSTTGATAGPTIAPPSLAERLCAGGEPSPLGDVTDPALVEVSGLVASADQPGVLWAVADSGSAAELVAIGLDGQVLASVVVEGAENVDWEDLALRRAPSGTDHLVLSDTGDNDGVRPTVALVVVPEPDLAAGASTVSAERWELTWPDGPRDAEAVVADPLTGELFLLSKHLLGGSEVVRVPAGAGPGATTTLEAVGALETGIGEAVTAADISSDGRAVVLRTYLSVLVFDRPEGTSVAEALDAEPCQAQAPPERQGESLAVLADQRGLVTVAEGGDQPLWMVPAAPG